jgi:hypothetical protein
VAKKRWLRERVNFREWLLQKAVASKALNEYPLKREMLVEQPLCGNGGIAVF